MKRYAVFQEYKNDLPSGGMQDFVKSFDSLDEARKFVEDHRAGFEKYEEKPWYDIFDITPENDEDGCEAEQLMVYRD
jgi:hypothetical protein